MALTLLYKKKAIGDKSIIPCSIYSDEDGEIIITAHNTSNDKTVQAIKVITNIPSTHTAPDSISPGKSGNIILSFHGADLWGAEKKKWNFHIEYDEVKFIEAE